MGAFGGRWLHLTRVYPQSTWLKGGGVLQGGRCSRNGISRLSGMRGGELCFPGGPRAGI